jgi:hypothetical protein
MNLNKKLLNLVESIANSPKRAGLESDALSAVIHYRLTEEGFQAEHLSGVVTFDGVTVPYEWLTFRGLVIDYRLKLQFSEKAEVPHGIFDSEEWPTVQYQVKEVVPVIGAVDYSFLVNVRRPRLLRGVPGICPPENLTQGRHDYLNQCTRLALAKGERAVQKAFESLAEDYEWSLAELGIRQRLEMNYANLQRTNTN